MASSDHSSDHEFTGLSSSKNGIESSSNMIQKMIDEQFKARDERITQLQNQVEQLKKENQKLQAQVNMSPDQLINNRSFDHQRQKAAQEIKNAVNAVSRVVDDVLLNQDHTTPRQPPFNYNRWTSSSTPTTSHTEANSSLIDIDDGSKNTNNSTINHPPPHMNNMIDVNVDQFGGLAQNRPSDDGELINEATKNPNQIFPPPSVLDGKTTSYIIPNQLRRFNNNHPYNNNINSNNTLTNNINNKNNKKGKSDKPSSASKYTVFIAWTGTMSPEGLKALFDNDEVEDIRFLPNKQFAHVDLKNEVAMKKALKLNGEIKVPEQGKLRVEEGKPRNASTENNPQRPQQNKPRQPNNNNNNNNKQNGYNSQQKHPHNKYSPNGHSQLNYNMLSHEEGKDTLGSPKQWNHYANKNYSTSPQGTIQTAVFQTPEN